MIFIKPMFIRFTLFALAFSVWLSPVWAGESPEPAGNSPYAWIEECKPPMAFEKESVMQARDQVKRIGWSEVIVDAQTDSPKNPVDDVWAACTKAALFGGKDKVENALQALTDLAANWDSKIQPAIARQALGRFIQSYDCLTAAPEWPDVDTVQRESFRAALRSAVKKYFDANEGTDETRLRDRSLGIYAGLLSGASEFTHHLLLGDENQTGFIELVNAEILPEGLQRGNSLKRHVEDGHILLLACSALKTCTPEYYAKAEPLVRQSVELVRDLVYPNGQFPSAINERPGMGDLILYLERGDVLFQDSNFQGVLGSLYKKHPRLPQSLLVRGITERNSSIHPLSTRPLPQTGAVIVNDATGAIPLFLHLDTGLSGNGLLSMEWKNPWNKWGGSSRMAGTLNTVVIDHTAQPALPDNNSGARNGAIFSSKIFDNGPVFVRVAAAGQFTERMAYPEGAVSTPVSTYERSLFLSSPHLIDIFRVRGGARHDWIYHSPTPLQQLTGGEFTDYQPDRDEYEWMRNSSANKAAASMSGIYGVQFKPMPGTDLNHRLWFIDPVGSQVIAHDTLQAVDLVVRREMQDDESDIFVVVHEWFQGDKAPDIQIEPLTLDPGANRRGFQAFAFAITQGENTHIYLSSINQNQTYTSKYKNGTIVFQGSFGHIHLTDKGVKKLQLVGGSALRYDTCGVELKSAFNFGVVRGVNSAEKTMNVDFSNPLPAGDILRGDIATVLTTKNAPVMYRPVVIDSTISSDNSQSFQLRYKPNFVEPLPEYGADIVTGDQLLYENMAELTKKNDRMYSLRYTAPADVTVRGATDINRVFLLKTSALNKIRGESMAGVVQFHLEPNESIGGYVEFASIP